MSPKKKRLFLIDGLGIAYRSFFAFIQRPLTTADGRNVSAVYGFTTFMNRIMTDHKPDYLAVAFDTYGPTFRHKAYAEYKATRERMPEDLSSQLDALKDVIRAHRVPILELAGFEADDIIGTLSVKGEEAGLQVYMVTGDKDLLQLVTKNVFVLRPGKAGGDPEFVDIEGVRAKFGVKPEQVIDVLALTGDSSDNVPGVPGVGEKTAVPLIQKYGDIEKLYKHLEDIPQQGVRRKLDENRKLAFLSKELVTIKTDAKVPLNLKELQTRDPDTEKLRVLYRSMEFRSLLTKLGGASSGQISGETEAPSEEEEKSFKTIETDKHSYTYISSIDALKKVAPKIAKAKKLVFDTETTSKEALRASLVGISFCIKEREAWFIRFSSDDLEGGSLGFQKTVGVPRDAGLKILKPILENPSTVKCGHNIKYDMHVLERHGIQVAGPVFDTMVASYLLRADAKHNMDVVSEEYLGYRPVSYEDLTGKGKEQKSILEVDPQKLSDYASEDSDITYRLWTVLEKKIDQAGLKKLSAEMEMPLVSVLRRMERTGVSLDGGYLAVMSKKMQKSIADLTTRIYRGAGEEFNINSTKQLGAILFDRLKLPVIRNTKTGYSTDVSVLEALRHQHPIVDALLEYRQLVKLKSTYVDALPTMIHPQTKRVHTSFQQAVAATGRLASSDPNLQNIPIRTEMGRAIRKAFVASGPNAILTSADYSQIELRIMAHVAGDETLQKAFRNGEDIHAATAAGVFGVALKDVEPGMRRKAKEVNFGIMYGIGAFGLSNRLEIKQSEAREIIDSYFKRYPKVRQYIHDTIATAGRTGYVSTLMGRRRYLPDLKSANRAIRQNAERQAINTPIQGTAADMIKIAMVLIDESIIRKKMSSRMILQVHDELVFEGPSSEKEKLKELAIRLMKEAMPLSVPLEVEVGFGKDWLEAH